MAAKNRNKTTATAADPIAFIDKVGSDVKRRDSSPRTGSLVLYIGPALEDAKLMSRLGKHKTGKGCLYINKLDDVDRGVLRKIVEKSVALSRKRTR